MSKYLYKLDTVNKLSMNMFKVDFKVSLFRLFVRSQCYKLFFFLNNAEDMLNPFGRAMTTYREYGTLCIYYKYCICVQ